MKRKAYSTPQLRPLGSIATLTGYETITGSEDDYFDASGTIIASGGGSLDGCVFKAGTAICELTDAP